MIATATAKPRFWWAPFLRSHSSGGEGTAPATWHAFVRHALEGESAARVASELGLTLNTGLFAKSPVLKRLRQEVAGLVK